MLLLRTFDALASDARKLGLLWLKMRGGNATDGTICVLNGLAFLPKWLTVRLSSGLLASVSVVCAMPGCALAGAAWAGSIGGATSSMVESMVCDARKGSSGGCWTTSGELVSEGSEPTVSATLSTAALLE